MNLNLIRFHANDNDALIPEIWAQEGLMQLEENMVMARLVYRDFSMDVAKYGDVVNTRRPGNFQFYRKSQSDTVTAQDASLTNVAVPLDQHMYVNFIIKDEEASKSFQDLVDIHVAPAARALAKGVDRVLIGQAPQFLAYDAGKLETMTSTLAKGYMLSAREKLNENNAPLEDRHLVLCPSAETDMLNTELFIAANQRGDGGSALEDARLGRVLGFNTYMDQNCGDLTLGSCDYVAGTVTGAVAAGGSGNTAVTITGHEAVAGEYVWVAGEGRPMTITASTASTDTTYVTFPAFTYGCAGSAVLNLFKSCVVQGGYAANYEKAIIVDGYTAAKPPQAGQIISFGTSTTRHTYTIVQANENSSNALATDIWLDRPLGTLLTDNDLAFPGPSGGYNLAFHRNAIALVSRPLAFPNNALGVRSGVAAYNDVAMRATMQYDISYQGTRVTLDMLCGVKVLDTALGCLLYS